MLGALFSLMFWIVVAVIFIAFTSGDHKEDHKSGPEKNRFYKKYNPAENKTEEKPSTVCFPENKPFANIKRSSVTHVSKTVQTEDNQKKEAVEKNPFEELQKLENPEKRKNRYSSFTNSSSRDDVWDNENSINEDSETKDLWNEDFNKKPFDPDSPDELRWNDDYYDDLEDEAAQGDIESEEEIQEDFGDDWE